MNAKATFIRLAATGAILLIAAVQAHAGTAITYQGSLSDNGAPANGLYDFQFRLYTGDWPLGFVSSPPIEVGDVEVIDGLFTVKIDFGNLNNFGRWLDIGVRPGNSSGSYTSLLPRQELTPAPSAIGLELPYSATDSKTVPLFTMAQNGTGGAMKLTSGAGRALDASTNGTGSAVYAQTTGSASAVAAYATGGGTAIYGQTTNGGTAVYGYNLGTSGRAGFFRTESLSNASDVIETQANGTGRAVKANARANNAGFFENTNASNTSSTLRSETNGGAYAVWGKTTGSGGAAKFEVANTSSNATALVVRNDGTGLAANFERGNVKVNGELYATIGTVVNRATPIAFGRFDSSGNLLSSSGNVTITWHANTGTWRVFVVGEGDPEKWVITTTVNYYEAHTDLEYVAKPSRPFSVAFQPGNGIIYIKSQCMNGCQEFQSPHYINFVIHKGV